MNAPVAFRATIRLAGKTATVPPDLAQTLARDPARRFASLSYTNQLRPVLGVAGPKTPETRQRSRARAAMQRRSVPACTRI